MGLKIRGLSGPAKNQVFVLKDGLKFGRSKGDVRLDDPKVSSLHAFIQSIDNGYVLHDNGSKNGIRSNGERVEVLVLQPGIKFKIGTSEFQVEEASQLPSKPSKPQKAAGRQGISLDLDTEEPGPLETAELESPSVPTDKTVATVFSPLPADDQTAVSQHPDAQVPEQKMDFDVPENLDFSAASEAVSASISPTRTQLDRPEGPKKWNDVLGDFATQILAKIENQPKALIALDPPLALSFTRGSQIETRWVLGYGPRKVGAGIADLPIYEPGAPDVCFEVIPTPDGLTFRTDHPNLVLFNGQSHGMRKLSQGDEISIGETRIEIEFLK